MADLVSKVSEIKALELKDKRKKFLQLFKVENYLQEGLSSEQVEEIKKEFNILWTRANEEMGDFTLVEELLDLILEKGLKNGFESYKKINKFALIKRKTGENLWEALSVIDFLKLFDPYSLAQIGARPKNDKNVYSKGDLKLSDFSTEDKLKWLNWLKEQKTKESAEKQADLSEQINETKIENQEKVEQQKVKNFRNSLVKREQSISLESQKSSEITTQEIPKTWEEFKERIFDCLRNSGFVSLDFDFNKKEQIYGSGADYNEKVPNSIWIKSFITADNKVFDIDFSVTGDEGEQQSLKIFLNGRQQVQIFETVGFNKYIQLEEAYLATKIFLKKYINLNF